MHASMLLGTLMGARDAIDNFPFEDYYKQIEGLELLENIYSYMESYSAEAKWYEEFDCLVKEFLNV